LAGNESVGTEGSNLAEWAIKFFNLTFDKFMFVNGNFDNWMITTKAQAIGSFYNTT